MQTVPLGAGGAIPRPLSFDLRPVVRVVAVWALAALFVGASPARVEAEASPDVTVGQASWYGQEFAWRRTASGERFDPSNLTGAHRTLPFGTRVRVTNLHNGRSVLVTITDRGPFKRRRMIDLSYGAARQLGMVHRGLARVRIELLDS